MAEVAGSIPVGPTNSAFVFYECSLPCSFLRVVPAGFVFVRGLCRFKSAFADNSPAGYSHRDIQRLKCWVALPDFTEKPIKGKYLCQ